MNFLWIFMNFHEFMNFYEFSWICEFLWIFMNWIEFEKLTIHKFINELNLEKNSIQFMNAHPYNYCAIWWWFEALSIFKWNDCSFKLFLVFPGPSKQIIKILPTIFLIPAFKNKNIEDPDWSTALWCACCRTKNTFHGQSNTGSKDIRKIQIRNQI